MANKSPKAPYKRARTRSTVTVASGRLFDRVWNTSTGYDQVITDKTETRMFQNYDNMDDVVTPGFAAIKARGGFVQSPMSRNTVQLTVGGTGSEARFKDGSWEEHYLHSNSTMFMLYGEPTLEPNTIDIDNLISYTRTNALSKCRTSSFMGLVALAELKKTLDMLKHPLDAMSRLADWIHQQRLAKRNLRIAKKNGEILSINGRNVRYRGKRYKGPGKIVRSPRETIVIPFGEAISGTTLMINLGFRPMMMDIDALLNDIPKAHQQDRQTFRSTASEDLELRKVNNPLGVGGMTVTTRTTTTHKVVVRVSVVVRDKFSVSQDFGVSLADIPEAAWELIPSSFLVDYVLNVGDYLGALRALATQDILTGSTTYTITSIGEREPISTTASPKWTVVLAPTGKDTLTYTTKVRIPGIGMPDGLAVLPSAKIVTPSHIQNTISLIAQKLGRIGLTGARSKAPLRKL